MSVNNTLEINNADNVALHGGLPTFNGKGYVYKTFPTSFLEGKDIIVENQGYCDSNCGSAQQLSVLISDGDWLANKATVFPSGDTRVTLGVGDNTVPRSPARSRSRCFQSSARNPTRTHI